MRVITGEYKDIQAGIYDATNAAVPPGAAKVCENVDFPEVGGIRARDGYKRNSSTTGAPTTNWVTRSDGKAVVGTTQGLAFGDKTPSEEYPQKGAGTPRHLIPLGDDILVLTDRVWTLKEDPSPLPYDKDAAHFELEQAEAGMELHTDIGYGDMTYKTISRTPVVVFEETDDKDVAAPVGSPDPNYQTAGSPLELNLDGINEYIGSYQLTEHTSRTPPGSWEPVPGHPQYIRNMTLAFGDLMHQIRDFNFISPFVGAQTNPRPDLNGTLPSDTAGINPNDIWVVGFDFPGGRHAAVPVALASGNANQNTTEWTYHFKKYDVNPFHNAEVQKRQNAYNKAMARYNREVVRRTSLRYVAEKLAQKMREVIAQNGNLHSVVVRGSTIRVGGVTQKATAKDSGSGSAIRVTWRDVQNPGDLPPQAGENDVISVAGVPFQFQKGVWKEIPGRRVQSVVGGSYWWANTGSFEYGTEAGQLVMPRAGSSEVLRDYLGLHSWVYGSTLAGRTILVSNLGVFVSAVGSPLDFFPSTSGGRPDDGYFVRLARGKEDAVVAALMLDNRLLVVSKTTTYLITIGSLSDVSITRQDIPGSGDDEVHLCRTAQGPLLIRFRPGFMEMALLVPSPEGTRYTTTPFCPQLERYRRNLRHFVSVTSDTRLMNVCVTVHDGTGHIGFLIKLGGQVPSVRVYRAGFNYEGYKWVYYKDELVAFGAYGGATSYCLREPGSTVDQLPRYPSGVLNTPIQAKMTLHAPPQFRTYAPDGRYTFKQAAAWVSERAGVSEFSLNFDNISRTFSVKEPRFPATLPIHRYGERDLTVTSSGTRWEIKALQYTVMARNGKTPSGWN